jgi:acetyl esterase/lipase
MTLTLLKKYQLTILILSTLLVSGCVNAKQPTQATKNIIYNTQGQLLDLYLPKIRDKRTAIMFIHGGGFKAGNKEEMAGFAKLYAENGFVTTSINYRLMPEHTYPAAINDSIDAFTWMKKNAQQYGYNANKIVLVGYSAGGTLSLNVGLNNTQNAAAVVSVAGVTDFGLLINNSPLPELKTDLTTYLGGKDPRQASPLSQVSQKSPPVFIFHGDKDTIVPISQSVLLAEKLKNNKVPVLFRVFPDAGHEIMLPNKHLKQLLKEMTSFILAVETKN